MVCLCLPNSYAEVLTTCVAKFGDSNSKEVIVTDVLRGGPELIGLLSL